MVALVLLLKRPVTGGNERSVKVILAALIAMALGLLAFVELWPFPGDIDSHNLESGVKNAYTMIGSLAGVAMVYMLEKKYVNFSEKAVWWGQILKAVLGFGLVLAVKEGMRAPLEALFAGHMAARAVRYFLIVVVAGLVWPMTFRWFGKLGRKN